MNDVGRQQVAGELDTLEAQPERACERMREAWDGKYDEWAEAYAQGVDEKRVKLIADIKAAGLVPMGTRSGKAGEFFSAKGLKSAPTRAISVGTRDVLLNEFDMYDEKWKMAKAELISATTPELLAKWVAWVNAGPSRGDVRSSR